MSDTAHFVCRSCYRWLADNGAGLETPCLCRCGAASWLYVPARAALPQWAVAALPVAARVVLLLERAQDWTPRHVLRQTMRERRG